MAQLSRATNRKAELTAALLAIVGERGLDEVSVREVAAAGGVSIGTVQHYFPTKDAMLVAAFEAVVAGIQARVAGIRLGPDPRVNLRAVLRELLPLDDRRASEIRVQVAFAARAAVMPELASVQRSVLSVLRSGISEAFALAGYPPEAAGLRAQIAIAATDGLALHAVSAPGWLSSRRIANTLDLLLDSLAV